MYLQYKYGYDSQTSSVFAHSCKNTHEYVTYFFSNMMRKINTQFSPSRTYLFISFLVEVEELDV